MKTIDVIGIMKSVSTVTPLDDNRFKIKYGNHKEVIIAIEPHPSDYAAQAATNAALTERVRVLEDELRDYAVSWHQQNHVSATFEDCKSSVCIDAWRILLSPTPAGQATEEEGG